MADPFVAEIRIFPFNFAPKVWAWNVKRVFGLKRNIDKVFSILPFEIPFFKRYDLEVEYSGNPVLDAVEVCVKRAKELADHEQ